jgi:hypothetical protein
MCLFNAPVAIRMSTSTLQPKDKDEFVTNRRPRTLMSSVVAEWVVVPLLT